MDESLQIEPDKIAIGALLQAERGKQKLTVKDVAEQLNLSESMISALENDQEVNDISPTYVRGYQRAYIRLLGIDETEILPELSASAPIEKQADEMHYFDKNLDLSKNNKGRNLFTKLAAVIVVFALAVFSWPKISSFLSLNNETESIQTISQSGDTSLDNNPDIQQSIELDNSTAVNLESSESVELNTSEPIQKKISTDGEVTTQIISFANDLDQSEQLDNSTVQASTEVVDSDNNIESEITQLLEPEQVPAIQQDETTEIQQETEVASVNQQETEATITFVSNGESWLSIEDAENNNLYRNTLKLDRISVTGQLPLNVSTGNVGVLRVLAEQGEQQNVSIFDGSKRVAKFYVDLDADGQLKFIPR